MIVVLVQYVPVIVGVDVTPPETVSVAELAEAQLPFLIATACTTSQALKINELIVQAPEATVFVVAT